MTTAVGQKGEKNEDKRIWNNLLPVGHHYRIANSNTSENVKGEKMRLIDTDVLFAQMEEHYGRRVKEANMMGDRAICATWNDAIFLIKSAPTVDAEPVRHGKWTRENNYGTWKCSVCGCKVNRANPLKGNIWNYYYCPNCGADMRGEQDE